MYHVIYYPKGQNCTIEKGFSSRESAWLWVKDRLDEIDWYKIEES